MEKLNDNNVEIKKIIIKEMIKRGKSIHEKNEEGKKLIHFVVTDNNNLEILKFIIVDLGGNIHDEYSRYYDSKVTHLACEYTNNLDIIKYLIKKSASLYDKDKFGFEREAKWYIDYNKNEDIKKCFIRNL